MRPVTLEQRTYYNPVKPTIDYIQTRFDEYNERFFSSSLPPIPIRLSHAKGFLGKVTFTRKRKGLFARYQNTDFVLRINVRIDLPQEVVDDTILHEMIHYYIAVNQWNDTSTHGELFRHEMARINREGNRHITISHRLSDAEQAQARIHKGRVVAVVTFADGRTGVKIVPKQIRHILAWDKQARRAFGCQLSAVSHQPSTFSSPFRGLGGFLLSPGIIQTTSTLPSTRLLQPCGSILSMTRSLFLSPMHTDCRWLTARCG